MPKPITFYACKFCREICDTETACLEHEAGCAWNCRHLADPVLRACPSCDGCQEVATGFRCLAKGCAEITAPVTLCRWHYRNRPAPVPAGQAQAQGVAS